MTRSNRALTPEHVVEALARFGLEIGMPLALQFLAHLELLLRWNEKIPLTTVTDPNQMIRVHIAESLFGAQVAGIRGGTLLDVGSGAGFPAIPIALYATAIQAVLLEPNLKKCAFLRELCRRLGLSGRIRIERQRLEEYSSPDSSFDFLTSRAVRFGPRQLTLSRKLLVPEGKLVLWTGLEQAATMRRAAGWKWHEPVAIPQSARRVILAGHPS